MIFFILIFFILACLSFVEQFSKINKGICQMCSFILTIFLIVLTTIRGNNTADYNNYKFVFESGMTDVTNFFNPINFEYEPLWSLVKWIVKRVWNNFHFHLFVIGSFCMILQHNVAKNFSLEVRNKALEHKALSHSMSDKGVYYFTYFTILWGLYYANIYVIRSSVALMITFSFSTRYIEEKKAVKFVISVLIAAGFHYSALVFFPAYFIYHYKSNLFKKVAWAIGITLVGAVLVNSYAGILGGLPGGRITRKIAAYMQESGNYLYATGMDETKAAFVILKTIANIVVLLCVGIYIWKFNKKNEKYEGYFNLYLTGCALYIITMFVGRAFARMSVFYNVYQIPMVMYVFSNKNQTRKNKLFYWNACMLYVLTRLIVNYSGPFIPFWENI